MFFEQFALEESELQKWLTEANGRLAADVAATAWHPDDRQILLHDDLPGMLSTNEPPATRFVIQRTRLIVEAATELALDATEEDNQFALACVAALVVGCAPVSRSVLLNALPVLCERLEDGCKPQHLFNAGEAGGGYDCPLDSVSFCDRCAAVRREAPAPAAGKVYLAMHAGQILSVAIRATAAADSVAVSDSLRGVQLSTSGQKSVGAAAVKDALRDHATALGSAVASAIGIVKQADRLANDLVVHAPVCAAAFTDAFASGVVQRLDDSLDFESTTRNYVRVKALLQLLESIGSSCAPGTKEGEIFAAVWDFLFDSKQFLSFVLGRVFTDSGIAISASLRQVTVNSVSAVLTKSKKWNERWRGKTCTRVAEAIAETSASQEFTKLLTGSSRVDQLASVRLLELGAGAAHKVLLGPRVVDIDGPPPSEFGRVRSLLPAQAAFEACLRACDASPNCDILHAAVANVFNTVASIAYSGGLSPSCSFSEKNIKIDPIEASFAAVAASVIVDECRLHEFCVTHRQSQLVSLADLLSAISHSLVVTFGDDSDSLCADFKEFCRALAADAVRASLNPEAERNLSEGEQLRRYCVAATERQIDIDATPAANSINSPSGSRVKVDEVDDLPPRSPGGSALGPPGSSPRNMSGSGITLVLPTPAKAAEVVTEAPSIRVIDESPQGAEPTQQSSASTGTGGAGTGNFSPPSAAESLSFDRHTDTGASDLSAQSSIQSQGSRKFGIVRRRTAGASPGSQPAASPKVETSATLPAPEMEEGAQLSLTSSLNESCHSGFDRGSSYETETGGNPLATRRQLRRATGASPSFESPPPAQPQNPTPNDNPTPNAAATDLFAAWGK
mmetsp:Transcript_41830/g.129257  ORF Transcript_41830/g.129257 Transcript_41830/m.129257 type:complete len:849 (-) Transcript_41830:14-2560(-)